MSSETNGKGMLIKQPDVKIEKMNIDYQIQNNWAEDN